MRIWDSKWKEKWPVGIEGEKLLEVFGSFMGRLFEKSIIRMQKASMERLQMSFWPIQPCSGMMDTVISRYVEGFLPTCNALFSDASGSLLWSSILCCIKSTIEIIFLVIFEVLIIIIVYYTSNNGLKAKNTCADSYRLCHVFVAGVNGSRR